MPRKLTTREAIEQLKNIYGEKYDYSKVNYKGSKYPIILKCRRHGDFQKLLYTLKKGIGCPYCSGDKLHIKDFLEKGNKIHNGIYDYSKVKFEKGENKVIIICKIHKEFKQKKNHHLDGHGCPQCAGNKKSDTKNFIKKAKKVHPDKYDYSKVKYQNNREKVIIICKDHKEFLQSPKDHLNGKGCQKCAIIEHAKNQTYTTEYFIEEAEKVHHKMYDYSKVKYTGYRNKVIIICKDHKEFLQTPENHLLGRGCYKCGRIISAKKNSSTTEEFIEKAKKIHLDEYDYSKIVYKRNKEKVIIICKEHKEFLQTPDCHLSGSGCPKCKRSTGEKKIARFLDKNNINYQEQKTFKDLKHVGYLKFDFYLEEYNLIIEFDGIQHFQEVDFFDKTSTLEDRQYKDLLKNKYCKKNNINLLRIK